MLRVYPSISTCVVSLRQAFEGRLALKPRQELLGRALLALPKSGQFAAGPVLAAQVEAFLGIVKLDRKSAKMRSCGTFSDGSAPDSAQKN